MTRIGTELNGLLAAMSLLSEGQTQKWDAVVKGGEDTGEPPGAGMNFKTLYDEWSYRLNAVRDAMVMEIQREQGRGPKRTGDKEIRDARVIHLWAGKSVGFVVYVENLPEADVVKIRKAAGRRVRDGEVERDKEAA